MIVNGYPSKAAALRYLREQGHTFTGLLAAPESNPKVAKNMKEDVLTAPLHLAPFNLSGFQVCAQASSGCAAACLHTAGNPAYMEQKEKSRIDRTRAYFKHRDAFMAVLVFEIQSLVKKAHAKGMKPAVRLNATSDLPWEHRVVTIDGKERKLMEAFFQVQFYDYTKITKRALAYARGDMPANYHLTFSKTEDNDDAVLDVLRAGGNVAAVFEPSLLKQALDVHGMQYVRGRFEVAGGLQTTDWIVIDGDATDYRPSDARNVIVALKAKGDAKTDTSGFVLR